MNGKKTGWLLTAMVDSQQLLGNGDEWGTRWELQWSSYLCHPHRLKDFSQLISSPDLHRLNIFFTFTAQSSIILY